MSRGAKASVKALWEERNPDRDGLSARPNREHPQDPTPLFGSSSEEDVLPHRQNSKLFASNWILTQPQCAQRDGDCGRSTRREQERERWLRAGGRDIHIVSIVRIRC